jgi:hypothetical protein
MIKRASSVQIGEIIAAVFKCAGKVCAMMISDEGGSGEQMFAKCQRELSDDQVEVQGTNKSSAWPARESNPLRRRADRVMDGC